MWFLCKTRSSGYRVRHPSREPCRIPLRPAKCERRTWSQHIEVLTVPTRSRHRSAHDFDATRAFEAPKRSRHDRNTGSGLGPSVARTRNLEFATPSSRRSFRSARLSVPGPDKVAFSRLLSRVAWLDQLFPRTPFRVPPSYLPFGPCPYHRVYVETPHSFLPTRFHVATPTTPFLWPRGAVLGITCHLPLFVRP